MTRRPLHLLAAVVLATAAGPAVARPAVARPAVAAGSAGYCPDANGVTVVVDFHELGGGVVIRCAPGAQADGYAALTNAGFTVAGTARWGTSFVCRINGKPGVDTESCVDTPPTSAYWSYWHATSGGSWTYSSVGVRVWRPPAGSFEGWSFSAGHGASDAPPPGATPTRPVAAPPPPPPPGPVRTTAGGQRPTGVPPAGPTGGPAAAGPVAASGSPPAPSASGTPAGSAPPGTTTGAPDGEGAAALPIVHKGLPVGTIAGVLVATALVAGALVTARRRRRTTDPGA